MLQVPSTVRECTKWQGGVFQILEGLGNYFLWYLALALPYIKVCFCQKDRTNRVTTILLITIINGVLLAPVLVDTLKLVLQSNFGTFGPTPV